MVIDIVSYTEGQLAAITAPKRQKICSAQLKKNALLRKLDKDIAELKKRLMERGVFSSTIFALKKAELTATCEAAIDEIREALRFYLRYTPSDGSSGGSSSGGSGSGGQEEIPYPVDYGLSEEDRMVAVREYYETTYTVPTERFAAFGEDTFARSYLGEMYAPLYHYFEAQI